MTSLCYAIGDIHGRDDLLASLHERIVMDHGARHEGLPATVIHLGDYIDGGANSRGVIDRLMRGLEGFETVCLIGNHEDMMLACLDSDDRQAWWAWISNGGDETLASFGVSQRFGGNDPVELGQALGEHRVAWLRSLKLYHRTEDYLFVHAGIVPGRPIEMQDAKSLLWIRGRFLESEDDHGSCVIHGHTPSDRPVIRSNRIGIDTGAVLNGRLTAAVLGEAEGPRFLSVEGPPGKGP